MNPSDWCRHPYTLVAETYDDGHDQALGQAPRTHPRTLTTNELTAWRDGWRAGLAARQRHESQRRAETGHLLLRVAQTAVNLYLAEHPYMRRWQDDMLSDAMTGAASAASRYDPALGASLTTVAMRRARGAVLDGVRERSPVSRDEYRKGLRLVDLPQHRQTPHSVELIRESGVEVRAADDFTEDVANRQLVAAMLADCNERERDILVAIMSGETQTELAARWGVTPSYVSQQRRACLARLRSAVSVAA